MLTAGLTLASMISRYSNNRPCLVRLFRIGVALSGTATLYHTIVHPGLPIHHSFLFAVCCGFLNAATYLLGVVGLSVCRCIHGRRGWAASFTRSKFSHVGFSARAPGPTTDCVGGCLWSRVFEAQPVVYSLDLFLSAGLMPCSQFCFGRCLSLFWTCV